MTSRPRREVFRFPTERMRKDHPMEIAEQIKTEAAALQERWDSDARWAGIQRPYSAQDVVRLRGRDPRGPSPSPPRRPSKLWSLITTEDFVPALGCAHRQPGREWSRPACAPSTCRAGRSRPTRTSSGQTYPDQSLYPANSVPAVVRRINNALRARRPDRAGPSGARERRLPRADRRRRRGRLRRSAQRIRADEAR